jgi:hypothetical protein
MGISPVSSTHSNIPPPVDPLRRAIAHPASALPSGNLTAVQAAVTA